MVWACGRSYLPPRTWQVLWCSPDPADENATADRYVPYSACSRPGRPTGSATTAGRPAASARIPSPASARSIGSARGPHIASTQWASAFSPEATLIRTGSDTVSVASYTTERGRTRASTPVVLRARSVRPHTLVASEPA